MSTEQAPEVAALRKALNVSISGVLDVTKAEASEVIERLKEAGWQLTRVGDEERLRAALKPLIRAAISDAYYEAKNDGETMEHAASAAASGVWTVLEGWSDRELRAALTHQPSSPASQEEER